MKFLTRKGMKCYTDFFSFHIFPQYPNIPHNQISCHISIKWSKRAVKRVALKRLVIWYVQKNNLINKKIEEKHYKIFIWLNKNSIEKLKEKMDSCLREGEKGGTSLRKQTVHTELTRSITYLTKRIPTLSSKRKKTYVHKNKAKNPRNG